MSFDSFNQVISLCSFDRSRSFYQASCNSRRWVPYAIYRKDKDRNSWYKSIFARNRFL